MKRIVVLDAISDEACRRLAEETGWTVEKRLGLTPEELLTKVDEGCAIAQRHASQWKSSRAPFKVIVRASASTTST
jgi:hypothetical protein